MGLIYRRLGDGSVVFDEATWQTLLLTPAAAVILETLLERSKAGALPLTAAEDLLAHELDIDVRSHEVLQALHRLQELNVIAPS
jgi:PqqD family protein of HPr-rel-A system